MQKEQSFLNRHFLDRVCPVCYEIKKENEHGTLIHSKYWPILELIQQSYDWQHWIIC